VAGSFFSGLETNQIPVLNMNADHICSSPRFALISAGIKLGGSTTFLINFAGELVRRRIPVEVISFERENPLATDFQKQDIPVLSLDDRRLIFEDRLGLALRRLASFRPTVLAATLGAMSFEVLRYTPKGIFRIGMAQADDLNVYNMMCKYVPWTDLAVVVSQAMKERVEAMPEFARLPVASLPYGVPMEAAAEMPSRNPDLPLRILYFGRLGREQKRVHLFPQILAHLCASSIPSHWTVAGEGGEREFLEANMKTSSPDQIVTFAGAVRYEDVPALLRRHDIFLLASDYEGLPLSLLEAMGQGLVPVVSDLRSGIPEVVDASNGMVVPVNDIDGYARAIIHLHRDREDFANRSKAAWLRVRQQFSIPAMTDRWLNAIPKSQMMPVWPNRHSLRAPVAAGNAVYFSQPFRTARRLVRKFQSLRK
jgi:glycosyltransferase involved in cell wall biosynthesis